SHVHKYGFGIKRRSHSVIIQIKGIVASPHSSHGNIHPLSRLVSRVINSMRASHPTRHRGGTNELGSSSVDSKLCSIVKDHEHLFHLVVEVMANARSR